MILENSKHRVDSQRHTRLLIVEDERIVAMSLQTKFVSTRYVIPALASTFEIFPPQTDRSLKPEEKTEALCPVAQSGETIPPAADKLAVRQYAASILHAQGYAVLEAADGIKTLFVSGYLDDGLLQTIYPIELEQAIRELLTRTD